MKLPNPIEIDLLTFIKTGKFDYLKLGQTKEWIINNFPDPDETYSNNYEAPIWFYGNIELHFYDNDELFLIYCDHLDALDGGQSIRLNKWILEAPEKLTLAYVIEHLNRERIGFKIEHGSQSSGYSSARVTVLESGVTLSFALDEGDDEDYEDYLKRCKTEDSSTFTMFAFSLKNNE